MKTLGDSTSKRAGRRGAPDGKAGASRRSAFVASGFRNGDPSDVERVRQRVRAFLRFRAFRIPSSERSDVEQEILAQLWQAVRKPDFDREGGFLAFVDVVATRRCIDWVRRRRSYSSLDESIEDARVGPMSRVLSSERSRLVERAFEKLGDPCHGLLEMHFRQGKRYRELAEVFGKSEGALRMQVVRCIRRVRELIAQMETASSGPAEVSG